MHHAMPRTEPSRQNLSSLPFDSMMASDKLALLALSVTLPIFGSPIVTSHLTA